MFANLKNSAPFFFICYNKIKNVLSTCSYTLFTVHEKKYCHFSKKEQKKSSPRGIDKAFCCYSSKNVKPSKFMFKIYTKSKT